ncbi:MAG: MarR family transcriptional regulator [Anaerolineaceae bacterium]|nr:MarR family transcriptional regulator [Anaerolineaceae bacterium]
MLICDISVINKFGKLSLGRSLAPLGLNWQEMIVILVIEQMPGANQDFLEPFLQTDKGNITKLIKKMETSALLFKRPNESDRRNLQLFLTEKSQALLPVLKALLENWEEACLKGLSHQERSLLKTLNARVIENMIFTAEGRQIKWTD